MKEPLIIDQHERTALIELLSWIGAILGNQINVNSNPKVTNEYKKLCLGFAAKLENMPIEEEH